MFDKLLYIRKYLFQSDLLILIFFFQLILFAIFELVGLSLLLSLINDILFNGNKIFFFKRIHDFFHFVKIEDSKIFDICIVLFFYLFKFLYSYFLIKKQHNYISVAHKKFAQNLFNNYVNGDFFQTSKISSRDVIRDVGTLAEKTFNEYFISIFNLVTESAVVLIILLFFFFNEPLVTLFLIFFSSLVGLIIFYYFFEKSKYFGERTISGYKNLHRSVEVAVGLSKEINALKLIKKYILDFNNNISNFVELKKNDSFLSRLPILFVELFVVSIILILITTQLDKIISDSSIQISVLAMFSIGMIRLIPSINRISGSLHVIRLMTPSIIELDFDNFFLNSVKKNYFRKRDFKNFNNKIILKKINIVIDKKEVVKNFNAIINKGDKIIISGQSGSGKSTLFNFFAGLIPISSGEVLVDKVKINKFLKFKNRLSFVSQENFLIPDQTIYFNITNKNYKSPNDYKKFINTLKICNLDNFIETLAYKENTILNSRTSNFSGGERQRLCIARALFYNFDILLLDEPFSSLDSNNANKILTNIIKNYKDKTIIFISHIMLQKKLFNKKIYL
jgi:ABC-type bacteriocin/lantibiotic exporter with double-glycine peptidase domain